MYLITRFSYVINLREYYYPSTYNYLFLNGGYGFQSNGSKGVYMGTNITIGTFTYSKLSENPYDSYSDSQDLFEEFDLNLVFQVNVGYRL
jgi:hypothetical protein